MHDTGLGLHRTPFHDTADPDLFYPSPAHEAAAQRLLAAALRDPGGLIGFTGDPGTGKTVILKRVIREIERAGGRVLWHHALETFEDIAAALGRSLGWPAGPVSPAHLGALGATLAAETKRHGPLVVAVDEAQHLDPEALAGLGDLADAGAAAGGSLAVMLAGQPDLQGKLAAAEAVSEWSRPVTRVTLSRLPDTEVGRYVEHRLRHAGWGEPGVFPPEAIHAVASRASGLPRVINQLCDTALRLARQANCTTVSTALVVRAARQLQLEQPEEVDPLESSDHSERGPGWADWLGSGRRRGGWAEVGFLCLALALFAYVSHPRLVQVVLGAGGPVSLPPVAVPRLQPASLVPAETPARLEPDHRATPPPEPAGPAALDVTPPPPETSGSSATSAATRSPGGRPAALTAKSRPRRESGVTRIRAAAGTPVGAPARPTPKRLLAEERALLAGAEDGDVAQVAALLARRVPPDPRDDHGLTPLMLAVIQGHGAVARALLTHGAAAEARDGGGVTPLMLAAVNDRPALLQALLARGAAVNGRSDAGWTALTYAAWQGHAAIVRRLLAAGADPAATDRWGWTASRYASWRGGESPTPEADEASDALTSHAPATSRYPETLALLDEAGRRRQRAR